MNQLPNRTSTRPLALLLWGLLLWSQPAQADPKTDKVILQNGDMITCDIKEMTYGKVRANTDDMGTVYIEWDKVARLISRYRFLVKLNSGALVYGQLPDSDEDNILNVVFEYEAEGARIPLHQVVSIESIRYDIWDRVDLSVSAGFNWTKASETSHADVAASANYKGRIYRYGIGGDATLTTERDNTTTRRQNLELYAGRLLNGRLQTNLNSGLQRNDQLGLALRASAGMDLGYLLIMSRHLELSTHAGLAGTREWATRDAPHEDAAEAVLTVNFTFFQYDSPKTNLSAKAEIYPSLTVSDRVRLEFDTSLRHEVVSDLFVELKYYESRDNHPPAGAAATEDRGVVFSLGWTK